MKSIDPRKANELAQMEGFRKPFKVLHTINLDWFEAMASGVLVNGDDAKETYEFDNGNIVLAKKGNGTKVFKFTYEVYLKQKLFGKCHVSPRSPEILRSDFCQFQVCNNVLYEAGGFSDIKYFFRTLSWKVTNITRFDIALDGVRVLPLVDRFVKGEIEKLGKAKVKPFFTGKRVIEGFDIGSKASNKWITGYLKSAELERSGKEYIKDFWKRTGLNTEEPIERLEIKIKNEEIKKIVDFDWRNLDDFEYLASIFRTCMKNFFEFVEKGKDSNVTRKKKINFVDWDFLGANLLERMSTQETTEIYRMKQSAKTNYWCFLASGRQYYSDIAQEQAININCLDWYVNKLPDWKHEYHKKQGHNKDGLISFQYLLSFETLEMNKQLALFEIVKKEKI
jgi:hypothetical protein